LKPGNIKGALLEYIVRELLMNCGFTPVIPDGHYIFSKGDNGLFFINGKGAAHDADVLMDPPIQLPFSYPSRLLFECKAYNKNIELSVIRNALGLRYDLNNFEIISDESIEKRKDNNRATYAISDRIRYEYQVGLASVTDFTKPAFEFAANNKIPLLSLSWFLSEQTCNLFNKIDENYITTISEFENKLYDFFKSKTSEPDNKAEIKTFLENDTIIGRILRDFNDMLDNCLISINEAGDLFFLFKLDATTNPEYLCKYTGRFRYAEKRPNEWELELQNGNLGGVTKFVFFAPQRIMKIWQNSSFNKEKALDIKLEFFSRLFVFSNKNSTLDYPFVIVTLDRKWIQDQVI
jgi:hypothetical protein